jgi:hypothetical protein
MKIEFTAPKFEVVKIDDFSLMRDIFAETRDFKVTLKEGHELDMPMSFTYFQNVTLKCQTSRLIREFFYTFQTRGKWSKPARDVLPDPVYKMSMEVPGWEIEREGNQRARAEKGLEAVICDFHQKIENFRKNPVGQSWDKVRAYHPVNQVCEWYLSLSIKEFIQYLSILKKIYEEVERIDLFNLLIASLQDEPILNQWLTQTLDKAFPEHIWEYHTLPHPDGTKVEIGSILYSHMVRNEGFTMVGYFDYLKQVLSSRGERFSSNQQFPITYYIPSKRMIEVLRIRTEWFANWDVWNSHNSWGEIIRQYITEEKPELDRYKKYLNCFDIETGAWVGFGKYALDEQTRLIEEYNNALPNAFLLESREILEQRIQRAGMNPLLHLYCQIFDRGYVKSHNPDNTLWQRYCKKIGRYSW